jgi:hypothetical protein
MFNQFTYFMAVSIKNRDRASSRRHFCFGFHRLEVQIPVLAKEMCWLVGLMQYSPVDV